MKGWDARLGVHNEKGQLEAGENAGGRLGTSVLEKSRAKALRQACTGPGGQPRRGRDSHRNAFRGHGTRKEPAERHLVTQARGQPPRWASRGAEAGKAEGVRMPPRLQRGNRKDGTAFR